MSLSITSQPDHDPSDRVLSISLWPASLRYSLITGIMILLAVSIWGLTIDFAAVYRVVMHVVLILALLTLAPAYVCAVQLWIGGYGLHPYRVPPTVTYRVDQRTGSWRVIGRSPGFARRELTRREHRV